MVCNGDDVVNPDGYCVKPMYLEIINQLTGKELCVYEKLTELGLYQATIGKFKENDNYTVTIKEEWGICHAQADACTDDSDIANGNISILIQSSAINDPLGFAATILHEGIHAELYKYVNEFENGVDPNDRAELF
jgi:hypothetical protein